MAELSEPQVTLAQVDGPASLRPAAEKTRKVGRQLIAFCVYGVIGWLVYRGIDRDSFALGFNRLRGEHVVVILLFALGHIAVRALRFDRLMRSSGAQGHYRLRDGVRLFLLGLSASAVTPGRAGDLIKARLVRAYGIDWNRGLGLVLVERMLDMLVICTSMVVAGAVLSGRAASDSLLLASLVLLGGLSAGTLVLVTPRMRDPIVRSVAKLASRVVRSVDEARILQHLHEMLTVWDEVFRSPLRFVGYFAVSGLAWGIEFAKLWVVLRCLEQPMNLVLAFFVYPASILAGLLSLLPVSDAVVGLTGALLMHKLAGIEQGLATTAIVVDRVASVVPPLLLWGFFAFVSRRQAGAGRLAGVAPDSTPRTAD